MLLLALVAVAMVAVTAIVDEEVNSMFYILFQEVIVSQCHADQWWYCNPLIALTSRSNAALCQYSSFNFMRMR